MAGLESIIKKIEDDSQILCADIIAKAEKEADTIRAQADEEAKSAAEQTIEKAQIQTQAIVQKAHSSAQMMHGKAMLAEKVALIHKVIDETAARLKALSDTEYVAAISKLALHYARPGIGVMKVSPSDSHRLPDGFEADLNDHLSSKDAQIHIETAQQELGGGFMLIYGDIEQNCTFSALIEAMQDTLKDKINKDLFA